MIVTLGSIYWASVVCYRAAPLARVQGGTARVVQADTARQVLVDNPGTVILDLAAGHHYIVNYAPVVEGAGYYRPVRMYFGPLDMDGDRVLTSQDFFDFLRDQPDYNADGTSDSRDMFDFLADFDEMQARGG